MNNGKHEIEDYKGQTIYYDEDDDKFVCDISIEDNFKTTKRKSLKDVRREIDVFIKENLNFKPFKAILMDGHMDRFRVVDVTGLRTDKKLIVKGSWRDEHYTKKDVVKLHKFDPAIIEEYKAIEAEYTQAGKLHTEKLKTLETKIQKLDLSNFDLA